MSFFSSIGHALGSIAAPLGGVVGGLFGQPELGTAIGGLFAGGSAHQAGQQARDAANRGAQFDINRFNQLAGYQQPYMGAGARATSSLGNLLGISGSGAGHGSLMTPYHFGESAPGQFNPTAYQPFTLKDFYNTSPAYQFQKQQGMQGVLNGASSGAGALSGAAQKDLMGFNQGLANTAWDNAFNQNMMGQQQRYAQQLGSFQGNMGRYLDLNTLGFNQYNTQQGNIYNRLLGLSGLGQQSAGELGQVGSSLGMDTAQGISNAGQAQAWGTSNMGNILGGTAPILGAGLAKLPWQGGGGGVSSDILQGYSPAEMATMGGGIQYTPQYS